MASDDDSEYRRRRADIEARARWEASWPAYLEGERRSWLTRSEALGRPCDPDEDPNSLSAAERTKLEAYIRARFDQLGIERRRSAREDRWRRFARVMPSRAFEIVLDDPDDTPAMKAIARWELDGMTEIAVMLGPPGTGKTIAAIWWAWTFLEGQEPPRFVTGAEIARSSKYGDERDRLLGAPSLILDDLGVENSTADIDELVDAYYRERSRLVITSNLTHAQFAERYGERVLDRLREAGTVLALTGPSLRSRP